MASVLYLLCGLQGTGKSTLADLLAAHTGALVLRSDAIRAELFPVSAYTQAESDAVFSELFNRARIQLHTGNSVILDAMFLKGEERQRARDRAMNEKAEYCLIEVVATEERIKERLAARSKEDPGAARYVHYLQSKGWLQPIAEAHLIFDNSGTRADMEEWVSQLLNKRARPE